jgi:hypothetical protein
MHRLRFAVLAALAALAAAVGFSTAAQASDQVTVVGGFRGSIRKGPLADLSLTGILAVTANPATHKISGVLVDESGPRHMTVLARVGGALHAHGATLVFRTAGGRVIRGTSTELPAADKVLRGSLRTKGGHGDWILAPVGALTNGTVIPAPTACLLDDPFSCGLTLPDGSLPHPTGGGKHPGGSDDGGVTGGNHDSYCAEQRKALGEAANTTFGMQLLSSIGC